MATRQEKREIAKQGYAVTASLKKTKYWTPDGREMFAFPAWREFSRRDTDGKVTNGRRDANFDKGWLPACPTEADLQAQCTHCDKWHDTEELVDECGETQAAFAKKWDKRAKRDRKKEQEKDSTDERMDRLEAMMEKLMEVASRGEFFQQSGDAPAEDTPETGESEARV